MLKADLERWCNQPTQPIKLKKRTAGIRDKYSDVVVLIEGKREHISDDRCIDSLLYGAFQRLIAFWTGRDGSFAILIFTANDFPWLPLLYDKGMASKAGENVVQPRVHSIFNFFATVSLFFAFSSYRNRLS
jgi:hypothetical protein